jgi:hypothetical protein
MHVHRALFRHMASPAHAAIVLVAGLCLLGSHSAFRHFAFGTPPQRRRASRYPGPSLSRPSQIQSRSESCNPVSRRRRCSPDVIPVPSQ